MRYVLLMSLVGVPVFLTAALLLLFGPWSEEHPITLAASAVFYPGWRVALATFAEGVHAGIPFFAIAYLANWVGYGAVAVLASVVWRRFGSRTSNPA